MKTVKHELEATKYTETAETNNSEIQVLLITEYETDLLNVQTDPNGLLIQELNVPQLIQNGTVNVQANEHISTTNDVTKNVSNDGLDPINIEAENTNK